MFQAIKDSLAGYDAAELTLLAFLVSLGSFWAVSLVALSLYWRSTPPPPPPGGDDCPVCLARRMPPTDPPGKFTERPSIPDARPWVDA